MWWNVSSCPFYLRLFPVDLFSVLNLFSNGWYNFNINLLASKGINIFLKVFQAWTHLWLFHYLLFLAAFCKPHFCVCGQKNLTKTKVLISKSVEIDNCYENSSIIFWWYVIQGILNRCIAGLLSSKNNYWEVQTSFWNCYLIWFLFHMRRSKSWLSWQCLCNIL